MTSLRRTLVSLGCGLLAVPLLTAGVDTAAHTAPADRSHAHHTKAAATAVAWQRIAVRTIFTEGAQAPPAGSLYLSFTSQAVHDAARAAHHRGRVVATAAVATAAHDVLQEYFAASDAALDADLAASMARCPPATRPPREPPSAPPPPPR